MKVPQTTVILQMSHTDVQHTARAVQGAVVNHFKQVWRS